MHWIVYTMLFVNTVDMKIKACNAFNAICRSSRYKTLSHISAHNFLNIQPIFNLQKVGKLRLRAFQLYHQILYMLTLWTQDKDL